MGGGSCHEWIMNHSVLAHDIDFIARRDNYALRRRHSARMRLFIGSVNALRGSEFMILNHMMHRRHTQGGSCDGVGYLRLWPGVLVQMAINWCTSLTQGPPDGTSPKLEGGGPGYLHEGGRSHTANHRGGHRPPISEGVLAPLYLQAQGTRVPPTHWG